MPVEPEHPIRVIVSCEWVRRAIVIEIPERALVYRLS